jgi:hypothetical protein
MAFSLAGLLTGDGDRRETRDSTLTGEGYWHMASAGASHTNCGLSLAGAYLSTGPARGTPRCPHC